MTKKIIVFLACSALLLSACSYENVDHPPQDDVDSPLQAAEGKGTPIDMKSSAGLALLTQEQLDSLEQRAAGGDAEAASQIAAHHRFNENESLARIWTERSATLGDSDSLSKVAQWKMEEADEMSGTNRDKLTLYREALSILENLRRDRPGSYQFLYEKALAGPS